MKRIILTYILSFIVLTLQTGFSDRGTEIPLFSDDGYSYNPYYSPMSDDFGDFGGWYNGGYGDGCSCPNGGYETKGEQKEKRDVTNIRIKIKLKYSGIIQIINKDALGSLMADCEVLGTVDRQESVLYYCKSDLDSKCCFCYRYVVTIVNDAQ